GANQTPAVAKCEFASKVPLPFQWLGLGPHVQHSNRRGTTFELAEYLTQLVAQPCVLTVVRRCIHFASSPQALVASLNEVARKLRFTANGKRVCNKVDFVVRKIGRAVDLQITRQVVP